MLYNKLYINLQKVYIKVQKNGYRVLCCEGGDQVGKADAILSFSEKLLNMNIPVTYSSFPMYATPFGTTIRLSLRNGWKKFDMDGIRELKVRMAFYAINRLEFMDVFLSNPSYKKTFILLDRSPYSNAVTVGYGLATMKEMKDREKFEELIEYVFDLEDFMIKKMKLGNCVIQMVAEDTEWKNVRNEKRDLYEKTDVQELLEDAYDLCQEKVGEGWKKIVTKTKDGWRSREDISNDIENFVQTRIGELKVGDNSKMYKIRYEIGIEEILNTIYKGEVLPSGLLSKYLHALRANEKEDMHNYACEIGVEVGKTCKLMRFKNKSVRNAAKKMVENHPEMMDVLSEFISKSFPDKLYKAVNE